MTTNIVPTSSPPEQSVPSSSTLTLRVMFRLLDIEHSNGSGIDHHCVGGRILDGEGNHLGTFGFNFGAGERDHADALKVRDELRLGVA